MIYERLWGTLYVQSTNNSSTVQVFYRKLPGFGANVIHLYLPQGSLRHGGQSRNVHCFSAAFNCYTNTFIGVFQL